MMSAPTRTVVCFGMAAVASAGVAGVVALFAALEKWEEPALSRPVVVDARVEAAVRSAMASAGTREPIVVVRDESVTELRAWVADVVANFDRVEWGAEMEASRPLSFDAATAMVGDGRSVADALSPRTTEDDCCC